MKKVTLSELNMSSRGEVIAFLKSLWNEKPAPCPICGSGLTLLHKKAKKNSCDWQCVSCDRVFRTIDLMDEMNQKMP